MSQSNPSRTASIVLTLSVITSIFWIVVHFVDVYRVAVIGAVVEIAWLPMIALMFIMPVLSFYFWNRDRFQVKSIFLYSLLLGLATVLFVISRD